MAKVPCSLTVFTLDVVNLLCATIQATLNIENDVEDGSCINDVWEAPLVVGKKWSLSANGPIDTQNEFLLKALTDPAVAVVVTAAGGTWTGTGIVTQASGEFSRRALDRGSITIQGQGVLVKTP